VNALAKTAGATPFKRPENGVFRPGSKFTEFYFDETGDTDNRTSASASGGFGAIFKLEQSPKSDNGRISVFYNGDQEHTAFDNVTFFSKNDIAFVEDAGDTLHTQRNGLDNAWLFDVRRDYSNPDNKPVRFIAEGRDVAATIDSGLSGTTGFNNDGDNEITGIHVSDGDPGTDGILGAKIPKPFKSHGKWRAFWTQQHGDNITWELVRAT
jgi:secreted PhoX family phosphatase